ncbi:MAG: diguanylate phosphodiesterase, partial [Candidatus Marinimicrobia bacterium]|nr:diguanylate phosphodiesterase [Candidatus Neomarinimicrobiota bacterium]
GSIQIMLPMVSSVDEVLKCKEILRDVQIELREEGTAFSEEINLGAMIETKDVMEILDDLAREVDFFSIGTNDLSLFLIGSERKSSLIKNHYHPVMFQAISKIVESAKRSQIPVNVCGEMGSDPYALIGLVAVGIRSVSVSVSALQQVAEVIRNISIKDAELIAEKILSADNALEIYTILNKFYKMNVEPDNVEVT